jgi:hypothetical protein
VLLPEFRTAECITAAFSNASEIGDNTVRIWVNCSETIHEAVEHGGGSTLGQGHRRLNIHPERLVSRLA